MYTSLGEETSFFVIAPGGTQPRSQRRPAELSSGIVGHTTRSRLQRQDGVVCLGDGIQERSVLCGVWCVVCDVWLVVQKRCVVSGAWCMVSGEW